MNSCVALILLIYSVCIHFNVSDSGLQVFMQICYATQMLELICVSYNT